MRGIWRLILVAGLTCLVAVELTGCGGSRQQGASSGKSYVIRGQRYHIMASADGYVERGNASWYGSQFHGRKTASGEVYNMYGMTAAHKTLPLQTRVKVTHLVTGREIIVRINDRGPFVRNRIIDLSRGAADKLGMTSAGVAPVLVEALGAPVPGRIGPDKEPVLVRAADYDKGRFVIQVGAFQDRDKATDLVRRLGRRFGPVVIQAYDRGDALFYRVQVSEQNSLGQAMAVQAELERAGYPDTFVVAP